MENNALIRFVFNDEPNAYSKTKLRIHAILLPASLNDPNTIDWVLAELEGCSFLFPRATIIVDWQAIDDVSYGFVRKFSDLRRRIEARGGLLTLREDGHGLNRDNESDAYRTCQPVAWELQPYGDGATANRAARVFATRS
ncbi:MAG: hypothetical protein HUU46_13835 [Candidatus Hydrogenedentes bacterium]|nr:hypothetical protein [Candidatus Hydrogenedentota bacterium]